MHHRFIFLILIIISGFACSESGDRFHAISKEAIKNEANYYILDQIVGHIHKSNASISYEWPEHKNGKITSKTNNFGFKRDSDLSVEKQDKKRILITGDSHIDGVINNFESCCSLLEELLNKIINNDRYEVLNAGCGYYSARNYLGIIKKYITLSPDVFIVIIYGGNDFLETCRLEGCNKSINPFYYTKLNKIRTLNPGGLWQGLNQLYYFKFFPESQKIALISMTNDLLEIKEICQSNNIELIVLLLPSKMDVEWSSDEQRLNKCKEILGLTDDDLQINRKILDKLDTWLNSSQITHLNLVDYLKNKDQKLFWNEDYHLNDQGHRFIAELLFTNYRDLFLKIQNCQSNSPR